MLKYIQLVDGEIEPFLKKSHDFQKSTEVSHTSLMKMRENPSVWVRHSGATPFFKSMEGTPHHKPLGDGSHIVEGVQIEGVWFPLSDIQISPRKTVGFERVRVKPTAWIQKNMRKKAPTAPEYLQARREAEAAKAAIKPKPKPQKPVVKKPIDLKRERFARHGFDYDYVRGLAEQYAKECIRLLSKKEYELEPLTQRRAFYLRKIVRELRLDFISGNYRSHWTHGEVKINIYGVSRKAKNGLVHEYKSYNQDPTIGDLKITKGSIEDALRCVVAHEVSHFVQYEIAPRVPRYKKTYRKSHGDAFKAIYRYLRKDYVNPRTIVKEEGA